MRSANQNLEVTRGHIIAGGMDSAVGNRPHCIAISRSLDGGKYSVDFLRTISDISIDLQNSHGLTVDTILGRDQCVNPSLIAEM